MSFLSILLVAFGLAADAVAVSMSSGAYLKNRLQKKDALRIAFMFGFFQFMMPVIGWVLGKKSQIYIESFDHWIAFGLLALVGGKMIKESFAHTDDKQLDPVHWKPLTILAVATSIDALAVGISMSLVGFSLFYSASIIGVVTFILSYIGVYLGRSFGHLFEHKVELLGGLILVGIGIKILAAHIGG